MSSEKKKSSTGTPISELEIDVSLVYRLLEEQHPDLAHLPIDLVDAGWDNVMFRLGDQLTVLLPRRAVAAPLLENEQTWLPQLANHLSIPVPTPYRMGKPARYYPWRWSILPWLPGVAADQGEPQLNQVERFVSFLRSLHIPAPVNAPANLLRGVPLHQRAVSVEERIHRLEKKTNLITPEVKEIRQPQYHHKHLSSDPEFGGTKFSFSA